MIADLHCHYPMHLLARVPQDVTLDGMVRIRRRPRWAPKLRAWVLAAAARLLNFRRFSDTWRVDLEGLESGDVRVALSVLYQPLAEMDLDQWYGAKPGAGYFEQLIEQLEDVERDLRDIDPGFDRHVFVRRAADLEPAIGSGRVAFLHCIEGGFHLGGDVETVRRNVAALADRGVAYITLAHLFWRRVATNTPALPFLPDWLYRLIFRQPRGAGLTDLGVAAVEAMYDAGILVDISHMRQDAIDETFAVVERLDRQRGADPKAYPVVASHAGFRCGRQKYMLDPVTVEKVAARDGVIGLILAQHQLNDGIRRRKTKRLDESVAVMRRHIDAIAGITGSHRHVGIGSDLDGFIKPTMGGIEQARDLGGLAAPLRMLYGDDADLILSGNAMRVFGRAFAGRE